jgi:outer membrane protein insertion porin family/translocation and assembly module TamA
MRSGAAALLVTLGFVATATIGGSGCASVPPGRAAVDGVSFQGVHSVARSDLESKIATTPSPKFLGLFPGLVYDYELFDPFVLQTDLERVERYYQARGFYEARVRAGRVVYLSPTDVRVTVEVEEGSPAVIGKVVVQGLEGVPPRVRRDALAALEHGGMDPGRRFDEDDFAHATRRLQRVLEDDSYAYARIEREARVDLPDHRVDVFFRVTPDQPATFGPVTIVGLGSLPEGPVRRTLDLQQGERYSAGALDSAQQALLDLGVFSSVTVTPDRTEPPPPDHVVPVTVRVTPSRLRSLRLGGGIELDVIKTDVHALVGWSDRNLLGGMRHFDVNFRPGLALYPTRLPDVQLPTDVLPEERLVAQLRQPAFLEARTVGFVRGQLNLYPLLLTPYVDTTAPVVGYREARATAGIDRQFWKLYAELTYNVQLNSPFTYLGTLDPDLQTAFVAYATLLTTFDFRDDRVHPHEGFTLGNELQVAGGPLGGEAEDLRVQPQARAYVPLGRATLALRGTTGLLFPANYGGSLEEALPGEAPAGVDRATWIRDLQLVYFRGFFSGGSTSNRGYPVYGVGPHGPVPFLSPNIGQLIYKECVPGTAAYDPSRCALPLGGLTLWEASAELRLALSEHFEEATFCDASDVEVGQGVYHFDHPHLSCGFGLRLQTPVGPIRLDLAYRVPGLNPGRGSPDYPGDVLGLPIGVAFGIGEPF